MASRPVVRILQQSAGTIGAGLAAALTWWAWMGRLGDTEYPVWTGVGCVVTLIVIGVVAAWWVRWYLVAVAMTVCFTIAYAATVVPGDDTGLSGVGVLMVLVGMAAGSMFVCGMTRLARGNRAA
ncbi:hypothetical protein [Flexivirga oryzae]|uniref:Uncharacterized protein n=1 Tax=Flexivirga oryzae TaxID=1794944 RepID=A0A839N190_9MICO|nr:hypothetical protein [Flexivirga oryzae]MBB2891137.1 hypothetical protein [Flexivirga oryzae]